MKHLKILSVALCFLILVLFCIHSFDSINNDIGRHLKLGEIIWQTKAVPHTNLFSFTEPDYPFINHHWLSEVLFYFSYLFVGLKGMIVLKTIIIFLSFLIPYITLRKTSHSSSDPLSLSALLLFVFIISERTEVRPEILSFLFFSIFLSILLSEKYIGRTSLIWILPVLELIWVNLHIYFFIGPLMVFLLLLDSFFNKNLFESRKRLILLLSLTTLATVFNPNWISGALYPLNVLKDYGYSIAENQSPFFLAKVVPSLTINIFKLSLFLVIGSFILVIKKLREKLFEFMLAGFLVFAGVKMIRNFSIYALGMYPLVVLNIDYVTKQFSTLSSFLRRRVATISLYAVLLSVLSFFSYQLISNRFYAQQWSKTEFGLGIPSGGNGGIEFIKDTGLKGPIFNNFDLGSYLIWKLYPQERVFVDGRPEAYSKDFFDNTYNPMLEDNSKWEFYKDKFGINLIIFDHSDNSAQTQKFLANRFADGNWLMAYFDSSVIIFVRNSEANAKPLRDRGHDVITAGNVLSQPNVKEILSSKKAGDVISTAKVMFIAGWYNEAIISYDIAKKTDPKNPYSYLGLSYIYVSTQTLEAQQMAVDNLQKAIDLGLNTSQVYTILGGAYLNLGRDLDAKSAWEKAYELNPEDPTPQEYIDKYIK